jgi:hypothetical protein
MKKHTVWVDLGFLPVRVGYVPRACWRATLKECKVDVEPFPETAGNCMHWTDTPDDSRDLILITLTGGQNRSLAQTVGLIAHECQHAWRHIRESIGEKTPSCEFEAYTLHAMVQCIVQAHQDNHKRPWKKPDA